MTAVAERFAIPAAAPPPIRPWMISFYFHPNYSGSAIQAHRLSQHLVAMGVQPRIVTANLSENAEEESVGGIKVHRLAVRKTGWQIPSFSTSLAAFLWQRRREFDVVHAHGTIQHGAAALIGAWLGKPTVLKVAMANSDLAFDRQGRVAGRLNRYMVRRFDRYIATTSAIAAELRDTGIGDDRICLIPNGVDTSTCKPAHPQQREWLRRQLGLPSEPIVSCVATINGRKNIDGVLRIWARTVENGTPGHLIFVGPVTAANAEYFRRLQDYIASRRLQKRVSFLGQQESVVPYLQASDAFLFPSRQEGMPNVVLEAMACGVPCLVSSSAGVAEIVRDGETGFTVALEDEAMFARRLQDILDNGSLQHRLAVAARQHVTERFALSTVASQYATLYQDLLARRSSAAKAGGAR